VRLLVIALVVQLVLAGLLIWGAATGFSALRDLFATAPHHPPAAHRHP
jgi:hypothetical protein